MAQPRYDGGKDSVRGHNIPKDNSQMVPVSSQPDASVILDLLEAFRRSKTMFAALKLGVFDALEKGPQSAASLAEDLQLDASALERLLDACVGLQLLGRQGLGYENTPIASAYLCVKSPTRMTGYLNYSNEILWKMWGNLEDAVREGTNRWQQTFGWDGPIFSSFFKTDAAMREFLMGMHGQGLLSSPHVAAAFDLNRFHRFVDLGGATGHLVIAACERYPHLRGVVFDLPETGPLAREIVGASTAAARIEIAAGDFFADPLPEGDIYSLGRILHDWTESKCLLLLRRIHERLRSGGAVLIAEKLLDEDKGGPRWALMQNLGMLLYTEGKERTLSEYKSLLNQVGFVDVQGVTTASPLDAVLAVKP
jgi:acetylserotonin N-methyltransferase